MSHHAYLYRAIAEPTFIAGTSVGDRIEATAVGEVFTQNLDVGTVKGNIGLDIVHFSLPIHS